MKITQNALTKLALAFSLVVALSACGAHYGAATIVSNPPGAQVINLDDGKVIGTTPVTMWIKDSSDDRKNIPLRLIKSGFYEKVFPFWLSMRHSKKEDAVNNAQRVEVPLTKKGN